MVCYQISPFTPPRALAQPPCRHGCCCHGSHYHSGCYNGLHHGCCRRHGICCHGWCRGPIHHCYRRHGYHRFSGCVNGRRRRRQVHFSCHRDGRCHSHSQCGLPATATATACATMVDNAPSPAGRASRDPPSAAAVEAYYLCRQGRRHGSADTATTVTAITAAVATSKSPS